MDFQEKFKFCPACGSANFHKHDFKSKHCEDCGFTYFFNVAAAAVAIILNERGEMLLCRRAFEPHKGTLALVGGFVDPSGETSEEAVIREIEEESGIYVTIDQLQYLFSEPNIYLYSGLYVHTLDAFYLVHIPSDTPIKPNDDAAECLWIRLEDINPADIGLTSIRNGVVRFLKEQHLAR